VLNRKTAALSALATLSALLVAALSGCGSGSVLGQGDRPPTAGTFFGPAQPAGNGVARAFVTLADDGTPTALGARFTPGAMTGISVSPPPLNAAEFTLPLPPEAAAVLPFQDISYGYTTGHQPPVLGEEHVFITFSLETTQGRTLITPDAPNADVNPEPRFIPEDHQKGFIIVPGVGLPWFDPTQPVFTGEEFVTNIDQAFFQGRLVSIIPETPVSFLSTRGQATAEIKQSASVQRPGYYPTRFRVGFDATTGEHIMALEGLRLRQ
jgi:hypothetical protein